MPFLRPYSHDREMKQVAAQIIDRIQRRVAARVVMTLSEAERALTLAQTKHFAQRVIL